MADSIAEMRIVPSQMLHVFRIRIEQELVRIEAVSVGGIVRPIYSVPIQKSGPCLR